jgi:DNA polymerase III sliding clamp (beta) subunit (PCNA family)
MATKTASKATSEKKQLITAIKKTIKYNATVPILEDVLLDYDRAIVSDLETAVSVPFKSGVQACVPADMLINVMGMTDDPVIKNNGDLSVTFTEGKKAIKVVGDDVEQYPVYPMIMNKSEGVHTIGEFTRDDIANIETALSFVSKDDLRPAMTGVYIAEEVVATDAHRMFWKAMSFPIQEGFIIPQKTVKIMLAMGGEYWTVKSCTEETRRIAVENEKGVIIEFRPIDSNFPDYKAVIPQSEPRVKLYCSPNSILEELKNAGKFANKSTNQVTFNMNGSLHISAADVDFGFEYMNEHENGGRFEFAFNKKWEKKLNYKNRPVFKVIEAIGEITMIQMRDDNYRLKDLSVKTSELIPEPDELTIAFNSSLLSDIVSKCGENAIEIQLWESHKAVIINKNFLLMPLMLNQ